MARTKQNTDETVSKKGELKTVVTEIEEIGGRVTSKRASEILSQALGRVIPITTVNNLAYADKLDVVKIGGVFLFLKEGEKSITSYIPTLQENLAKKSERVLKEDIAKKKKQTMATLKQLVEQSLAKNGSVDLDAIKTQLGL